LGTAAHVFVFLKILNINEGQNDSRRHFFDTGAVASIEVNTCQTIRSQQGLWYNGQWSQLTSLVLAFISINKHCG
jgi:hypothetical protein